MMATVTAWGYGQTLHQYVSVSFLCNVIYDSREELYPNFKDVGLKCHRKCC